MGVRRRVEAVPAWAWLIGLVALSFGFRAWLARGMPAPFIMVDELIYSELAKSFAATGDFAIRGTPTRGYGVVYPVLISPAYALFDAIPDAYAAIKTTNALLMSLAAVPAYLLARRIVRPGHALVVALLTVAVPSLVYTATVMTENAFYPLFLCVCVLIVWLVEKPSWWLTVATLLAIVVAYETRAQAIALVPALLTAPLLLWLFSGRPWRVALRPFALLYGLVLGGALLVVLVQTARGAPLSDLLGAYDVVSDSSYDVSEILRYLLYHWAELTLYLAVIPVAATIVLVGTARSLDARLQSFLAVALSTSFWLVLAVAVFASRFAFRIQERNMFVVAPLFFCLLLAWVERGAPRPRVLGYCAAGASALLVLAIPFERFVETSAISDTLMLLPLWSVQDSTGLEWVAEIAFGLALAGAIAFLVVPARYALALPALVLVVYGVVLKPVWFGPHGVKQAGIGALYQGIRGVERGWIDTSVPEGEEAQVLWTGRSDRFTVNMNEFFNRRVGRVLYTGQPTPGGAGETPVEVGEDGLVRSLEDGEPVAPRWLLADGSLDPNGTAVARDPGLMTLWRLRGPLVSTTRVEGLYEDTWSGPEVTWTKQECPGGTLTVTVSGDPTLFGDTVQTIESSTGETAELKPAELAIVRVPAVPDPDGTCSVSFTVAPTAVPAEVIPGSADDRELGAHFTDFAFVE